MTFWGGGGRPAVNRHDCLFFEKGGGSLPHRAAFGLLALCKSPCGHVVLHHSTFLQLVPNGVRMVGAGYLKKLLEVIGGLSCLTLEIMLSNGDELLVRVVGLLVVVALVTASGDHDSSGSPLWPSLVTFGTPLCAFTARLERRPSTTARGRLVVALNKNGPDYLLARGVPSGDVE
jgi:hypothetical protein